MPCANCASTCSRICINYVATYVQYIYYEFLLDVATYMHVMLCMLYMLCYVFYTYFNHTYVATYVHVSRLLVIFDTCIS